MRSTGSTLQFVLRSLRHRNYRLFFMGQSLSLIGTWMTQVATSWLVYRLTNSALLLGLVGFSGQIPALLLAPFGGVWVDPYEPSPPAQADADLIDARIVRSGGAGLHPHHQHLEHHRADRVSGGGE